MDTLLVVVVGATVLVITGLAIKISLLKAKLEGFREAQQQMNNGNYNNGMGNGSMGYGCLQALAVIGFLALCAFCVYVGAALF